MEVVDKKIGEILVDKGLLKLSELDAALKIQEGDKSLLGKILVGENFIHSVELQKAIAEKYRLAFVDFSKTPPQTELPNFADREDYLRLEVMPWRKNASHITLAITEINEEVKSWARSKYPNIEIKFVITSAYDILWQLQEVFEKEDDESARLSLLKINPLLSAYKLLGKVSIPISLGFVLAIIAMFFIAPEKTFLSIFIFLNALFFLTISFKIYVFFRGMKENKKIDANPKNFPVYTALVPLYMERETLPALIDAIKKLDYPKAKLDVKFVVEADDEMTIKNIKALNPPRYIEIIRTPYSLPRTKPKACNYALRFAKGEYLTIFDAEDIPHPKQLKTALAKFESEDKSLACVQARLNYFNYTDNQITKWFALEYATWFDYCMKGFEKLNLPIPLGGTSNHIKTKVLKEIGGWDAFNVTEDADIGMRLARLGYKTATIDSITLEEAPSDLIMWIKQRTRWIKGFVQTYVVHMRKLPSFVKATGFRGFLALQFFIGAPPIIYITAPFLLISSLILTTGEEPFVNLSDNLFYFSIFNLFYGAISHIIFCLIAAKNAEIYGDRLFKKSLIISSITFPFYGLMHIAASFRAVHQLIFKPHYWDKTQHGLTKVSSKGIFK